MVEKGRKGWKRNKGKNGKKQPKGLKEKKWTNGNKERKRIKGMQGRMDIKIALYIWYKSSNFNVKKGRQEGRGKWEEAE